jgi:hypothetical protein
MRLDSLLPPLFSAYGVHGLNFPLHRPEVAEREHHRAKGTEFLGRRLRQLASEPEKLLRAYYVDAMDVQSLKREQARTSAEVAEAESQLANDGGEGFRSCCRRPRMSRRACGFCTCPGWDSNPHAL